jgi:tetratricopeptide (TPR) repeat protein
MQAKATILQLCSRYELALTSLSQALIVNPQDDSVLNDRGLVLRALQQRDVAISSYLAAVDVRPDFPKTWSSLGLVYLETMQTTAAVAAYDKALVLRPHHAESRVGRAIGSLRLGDYAAAWPDYEYRLRLSTPKPIIRPFFIDATLDRARACR